MRRDQRGYTLVEVLVSLAVIGGIVAIFAILAAEMRSHQKRLPINFMRHPQISAVVSRMKKDVLDAHGSDPYKAAFNGYTQTPKTLIVESVHENGGVRTIVWDFREKGIVTRREFNVGVEVDWVARGLPETLECEIGAVDDIPGNAPVAVLFTAKDEEGRIAISQILQPRAHD